VDLEDKREKEMDAKEDVQREPKGVVSDDVEHKHSEEQHISLDVKDESKKTQTKETETSGEQEHPGAEALDDQDDHEDDEEEDDSHGEEEDYSNLSREDLVDRIESIAKEEPTAQSIRIVKDLRAAFEELDSAAREAALEKFIASGGEADAFEYKPDELTNRFDAAYKLLMDRRNKQRKSESAQREENLIKKNELLERLREFVDAEETNTSIHALKSLQEEWKSIGPVPPQLNKGLWANYNALIDRFYDNRSIYFELKELDRKKNLEGKSELCEKAEALSEMEDLQQAIKALNELHEEFKHIGPIPKETQEEVWQRFKAASDKVYARRKAHYEAIKSQLYENLKIKEKLVDKVEPFAHFDSDRISDWNKKTKEILGVQKEWEAVGGLPRDRAKEINKRFWSTFKKFFNNKGKFFKKLDKERDKNLEKKRVLVSRANEVKESEDWEKTANLLKEAQREWREIGPVPEKYRDGIYKEFKAACDYFFDRRRAANQTVDRDYQENLKAKEALCQELEKLANNSESDMARLKKIQQQWDKIGFVPKRSIKSINRRYQQAVGKFINNLEDLDEDEKKSKKLEYELKSIKDRPNGANLLFKKELDIKKQISELEHELNTWRTNLEFFAKSKTADKLKEEFDEKIEKATDELEELKTQLKVIHSI